MNDDPLYGRRLRVVAERPLARLISIAVTALLGSALVLLGYHIGSRHELASPRNGGDLTRSLAASERRVEELERRLADTMLSQVMDDDAYERLRQTIKTLRDRLAESEEEVRLYRQLMAPADLEQGLRIERLDLRTAGGGEVEYRLLLTQIVDDHDWIYGTAQIEVLGDSGNDPHVLSLTDLATPAEYPLPFRFRYFQTLSGSLRIPEGFTPVRATVRVEQADSSTQLEQSFGWQLQEG